MIHKTTRSILSVLLAALLLVTSTPLTPAFAGEGGAVSLQSESAEGRALEKDDDGTYLIYTADDLKEFADIVNGTHAEVERNNRANAKLMENIDLEGSETNPWTPIGTSSSRYSGTFDGDGHTISGLYIVTTADDQGLFGYVGIGGTVKDLTVSGTVSGKMYVGGVVGQNLGTVTNCAFSGSVSGSDHVGGVVGYNGDICSVTNCYNTGAVSGGEDVGGVVGYNDGSVENCYNTGTVTGTDDYVGGVVGQSFSASVTNSYNTGEVSGNSYVGGVVGQSFSASVTNSYNTGEVSGTDDYVGGVVGWNDSGNVTGCYFLQTETVNTQLQGIGSDSGSGSATPLSAEAFESQEKFTSWDFDKTWEIESIFGRPTLRDNAEIGGTANNPYKIFTATQLKTFRDIVNGENGNPAAWAVLMENITLNSSEEWEPIGSISSNPYSGTFDGNNYTISGLYIDSSDTEYQGLFGCLDQGGTVKDLTVSGSVKGHSYVGGVVGDNNGGTVTGCIFSGSGSVSGSNSVGGVVGENSGSVINCYNTGSVTGVIGVTDSSDYVGGVVGENSGSNGVVENCHNAGKVSGRYVGGVVGSNSGTVENCYNTGTVTGVTGSDHVGGVVGYNDSSASVANCYYQTGKGATVGIGGTIKDDISQTAAKSLEDFHSGEVAYLLQGTQTTPVWGQSNLKDKNSWPTLIALDESAQPVYQVTVVYGDYADAPKTETSYTNNPATPSETPSRKGYTFGGWDKTEGEGNTITYTAKWTAIPATYTVTFDSQGGSAVNDQTVTEGQTIIEPAAPTRDGYTFAGWFTEDSGGSQWNFSTAVTENMTLYAQWTPVEEPEPTPTPTPDPEPTGPSTGDSTGWDDIRDELENAENGDQITIDMGDETKVPAEIFESLAGQDITLEIALEGGVTWTVNGQDIPADANLDDLDLGVEMGSDGIPVNVINTITGEVGTVQITLAHDGDFGFTMMLTAPLGAENAGYWANLYHYDEDAEQLTFETAAEIDADGSVSLSLSHASQYAIVIDTYSHATVDVSDLFIDIAPDAWYKDAVQYAYDNGLMTGVSDTEFAPEATTTRAMIVSILARLEGVTTAQAAGFADVDDEWYATAVNWAANVGVVNGYEDNTFRPNTAITREQLAAILMNYAAYKGEDVSARAALDNYTDQPSTWATETMSWAVAEGLISGVTADTLQPQGAATRAQVAAILQRFLSE